MAKQSILTDEDLVKIFSYKERSSKQKYFFMSVIYKLLIFLSLSIAVYVVINLSAITSKIKYWYNFDFKSEQIADKNSPATPTAKEQTTTPKKTAKPVPADLPNINDNIMNLPAINITAPITWQVNNTAKEVSKGLENGLIQINGTSLPGEKGNIYITGHSSNYIWAKGSYNSVFSLLNKLVVGDVVYLKYKNITYKYKIFDQKIVLPTDMSVMQPTKDSRLTLVTCWPVGTSLKRIVLTGEQVWPDPAENKDPASTATINSLPGGR